MSRYLIVADPIEALNPVFDLGVFLSMELLHRGFEVDYLDLLSHDHTLDRESYLNSLPVRSILSADNSQLNFWELGPLRTAAAGNYDVILHRKDPPVDDLFRAHHSKFAGLEVLQINEPPRSYELSEHTIAMRFPEFAAPTTICTTLEQLIHAIRSQVVEAVCKPMNTYCGIGITFLPHDAPEEQIRSFWELWAPEVIVQPYIPEIERSGDLRILTLEDHVLGSVLRVPAEGSRLANLHQGARAARLEPSPRQLRCCREVAAELNPLGLHLLGLDFIGEYLTEINITSPTTLVQINQVNRIRADRKMVDILEAMHRGR